MSILLTRLRVITVTNVARGNVMSGDLTRGERLQIMLSPEELAALDDFRFRQRMPSRAAAVRELFRLGLTMTTSPQAAAGQKSADFGVGAKSHNNGSRLR